MRQSERHHMHAPRGRLTRILLAIMAALLVGLARPTRAQAAVTLTKDGLESADRATCVIDVDSYQDFTFEASEGSPFRLDTRDGVFKEYVGGTEHVIYGVYVDYTPQAGVTTLPGYFEITYPKGLLDADGNRHDLHVRFSNVIYKWARSPQTGPVAQQLIGATDDGLRIMAECSSMLRDSEVVPYDPWSTGTVNPFGVSCDIRMWCDDDATLLYNVYARDIDQPDRFTGRTAATCSYEGEWSESLEPLGTFESFHVHKDSWLRSDGIRIRGTKSDNDEALNRSGFVGLGTMSASSRIGDTPSRRASSTASEEPSTPRPAASRSAPSRATPPIPGTTPTPCPRTTMWSRPPRPRATVSPRCGLTTRGSPTRRLPPAP